MTKVKLATLLSVFLFSLPMEALAGQWKQDVNGWRYQNDDGAFKTGWHQDADQSWYYLDDQTTYMLTNTSTPDGYMVASNGAWIQQDSEAEGSGNMFDNVVDVEISATSKPGGAQSFGYAISAKIYYNDEYRDNGISKVTKVEMSKDGVPYIYLNSENGGIYLLDINCVYKFESGDVKTESHQIMASGSGEKSVPLLKMIGKPKEKITSIEIRVEYTK